MVVSDCSLLFRPQGENDLPGTLIPEASGLLQYTITKEAIGKFISFQCIPVRDDGIVGEARTCMSQERVRPGNVLSCCLIVYMLQFMDNSDAM